MGGLYCLSGISYLSEFFFIADDAMRRGHSQELANQRRMYLVVIL